jgi:hypothetical protein
MASGVGRAHLDDRRVAVSIDRERITWWAGDQSETIRVTP